MIATSAVDTHTQQQTCPREDCEDVGYQGTGAARKGAAKECSQGVQQGVNVVLGCNVDSKQQVEAELVRLQQLTQNDAHHSAESDEAMC